ncbi:MAG: hypothetical protein LQ341_007302 [Variospora aurantia]|nr:MAG: hypothetical protein LQ341_007302 [Variospora aurantia]
MLTSSPQLEDDNDPREGRNGNTNANANASAGAQPDRLPQHPLHHLNPWVQERPDPDDGNIEHVEWNPSPGLHFSRTSYRSSSPRGNFPGQPGTDPFSSLFQNMFDTQPFQGQHPATPRRSSPFPMPFSAPPHQAPWGPQHPGFGGRNTYTSTTRVWPTPPSLNNTGNDHLQDVMRVLFENIAQASDTNAPQHNNQANNPRGGHVVTGFPGLHQLFASILNPANAAQGDVVYSEEALDRIISQFMESQNGSSAPGPASAAAIEALPTKKVDKDMLGTDGKAECSVCMDNVELDDEAGHYAERRAPRRSYFPTRAGPRAEDESSAAEYEHKRQHAGGLPFQVPIRWYVSNSDLSFAATTASPDGCESGAEEK